MLTLFKSQTLLVDHGRVFCPIRGDIDVEQCFGCPWVRSAELGGKQPDIVCQAPASRDVSPLLP